MAYQVLARKYRPQRFADVAGQEHVTVTLMNALTQGRIAHGYIFSGHRGIGKTTIARILAMALNCRNTIGSEARPTAEPCEVCESCTEIRAGNAVDVIEIDAATNRGIDEIRELRDAARYRPARDRYKIYILDEAHQITDAAFNALLKTLEEPPDHIVFMMATTQPEDIPQTVRSRCQHFSFHAVKMVDILRELRGIAEQEGVDADEGALSLLAEAGDGSMRDALSVMDQAIASAPLVDGRATLDASQIRELMGAVPNAVFERVMGAVDGNRSAEVITVVNDLMDAGNSPAQLARQFVRFLRNCVVAKIAGLADDGADAGGGVSELLQISPDEQRRAGRTAALFSEEELTRFLQVMLRTFDELGYRQEQRFHFELGLLKLVHLRRLLPVEDLLSQMPFRGGSEGKAAVVRAMTTPAPGEARPPAKSASAPTNSPAKPGFSPLATDTQRKRFRDDDDSKQPPAVSKAQPLAPVVAVPERTVRGTAKLDDGAFTDEAPAPGPNAATRPILETSPASIEELVSLAPAIPLPAMESAPTPVGEEAPGRETTSADAWQQIAVNALMQAASQGSAADAIEESTWSLGGEELRVQTLVSKTMLPMVINPEADKILRAAIREHGGGHLRLILLPGASTGKGEAGKKKARTAGAGTVQAKAEEHPIVQQAQRLFQAEIRNVIDLRDGK